METGKTTRTHNQAFWENVSPQIDAARERTLAHNPSLQIERFEIDKARQSADRTRTELCPTIDIMVNWVEQNMFETQFLSDTSGIHPRLVPVAQEKHTVYATFEQTLFNASFFPEMAAKKLRVFVSQSDYAQREQDIVFEMVSVYIALGTLRRSVFILREDIAVLTEMVNVLKDNVARGYEQQEAYIRMHLTLSRRVQMLYRYQKDIRDNEEEWQALLGLTERVACFPSNEAFQMAACPMYNRDNEDLLAHALAQRWDVKQLRLTQKALEKEKQAVTRGIFPIFYFQGTYGFLHEDRFRMAGEDAYWSAVLGGQLPIFQGGLRRVQIAEVKTKIAETDARLVALNHTVKRKIQSAILSWEEAQVMYQEAKKSYLLAERLLAEGKKRMARKHMKQENLVSMQLAYNEAEMLCAQALGDVLLAYVTCHYVLGEL